MRGQGVHAPCASTTPSNKSKLQPGPTAAAGCRLVQHCSQQASAVQQHWLVACQWNFSGGHKLEG